MLSWTQGELSGHNMDHIGIDSNKYEFNRVEDNSAEAREIDNLVKQDGSHPVWHLQASWLVGVHDDYTKLYTTRKNEIIRASHSFTALPVRERYAFFSKKVQIPLKDGLGPTSCGVHVSRRLSPLLDYLAAKTTHTRIGIIVYKYVDGPRLSVAPGEDSPPPDRASGYTSHVVKYGSPPAADEVTTKLRDSLIYLFNHQVDAHKLPEHIIPHALIMFNSQRTGAMGRAGRPAMTPAGMHTERQGNVNMGVPFSGAYGAMNSGIIPNVTIGMTGALSTVVNHNNNEHFQRHQLPLPSMDSNVNSLAWQSHGGNMIQMGAQSHLRNTQPCPNSWVPTHQQQNQLQPRGQQMPASNFYHRPNPSFQQGNNNHPSTNQGFQTAAAHSPGMEIQRLKKIELELRQREKLVSEKEKMMKEFMEAGMWMAPVNTTQTEGQNQGASQAQHIQTPLMSPQNQYIQQQTQYQAASQNQYIQHHQTQYSQVSPLGNTQQVQTTQNQFCQQQSQYQTTSQINITQHIQTPSQNQYIQRQTQYSQASPLGNTQQVQTTQNQFFQQQSQYQAAAPQVNNPAPDLTPSSTSIPYLQQLLQYDAAPRVVPPQIPTSSVSAPYSQQEPTQPQLYENGQISATNVIVIAPEETGVDVPPTGVDTPPPSPHIPASSLSNTPQTAGPIVGNTTLSHSIPTCTPPVGYLPRGDSTNSDSSSSSVLGKPLKTERRTSGRRREEIYVDLTEEPVISESSLVDLTDEQPVTSESSQAVPTPSIATSLSGTKSSTSSSSFISTTIGSTASYSSPSSTSFSLNNGVMVHWNLEQLTSYLSSGIQAAATPVCSTGSNEPSGETLSVDHLHSHQELASCPAVSDSSLDTSQALDTTQTELEERIQENVSEHHNEHTSSPNSTTEVTLESISESEGTPPIMPREKTCAPNSEEQNEEETESTPSAEAVTRVAPLKSEQQPSVTVKTTEQLHEETESTPSAEVVTRVAPLISEQQPSVTVKTTEQLHEETESTPSAEAVTRVAPLISEQQPSVTVKATEPLHEEAESTPSAEVVTRVAPLISEQQPSVTVKTTEQLHEETESTPSAEAVTRVAPLISEQQPSVTVETTEQLHEETESTPSAEAVTRVAPLISEQQPSVTVKTTEQLHEETESTPSAEAVTRVAPLISEQQPSVTVKATEQLHEETESAPSAEAVTRVPPLISEQQPSVTVKTTEQLHEETESTPSAEAVTRVAPLISEQQPSVTVKATEPLHEETESTPSAEVVTRVPPLISEQQPSVTVKTTEQLHEETGEETEPTPIAEARVDPLISTRQKNPETKSKTKQTTKRQVLKGNHNTTLKMRKPAVVDMMMVCISELQTDTRSEEQPPSETLHEVESESTPTTEAVTGGAPLISGPPAGTHQKDPETENTKPTVRQVLEGNLNTTLEIRKPTVLDMMMIREKMQMQLALSELSDSPESSSLSESVDESDVQVTHYSPGNNPAAILSMPPVEDPPEDAYGNFDDDMSMDMMEVGALDLGDGDEKQVDDSPEQDVALKEAQSDDEQSSSPAQIGEAEDPTEKLQPEEESQKDFNVEHLFYGMCDESDDDDEDSDDSGTLHLESNNVINTEDTIVSRTENETSSQVVAGEAHNIEFLNEAEEDNIKEAEGLADASKDIDIEIAGPNNASNSQKKTDSVGEPIPTETGFESQEDNLSESPSGTVEGKTDSLATKRKNPDLDSNPQNAKKAMINKHGRVMRAAIIIKAQPMGKLKKNANSKKKCEAETKKENIKKSNKKVTSNVGFGSTTARFGKAYECAKKQSALLRDKKRAAVNSGKSSPTGPLATSSPKKKPGIAKRVSFESKVQEKPKARVIPVPRSKRSPPSTMSSPSQSPKGRFPSAISHDKHRRLSAEHEPRSKGTNPSSPSHTLPCRINSIQKSPSSLGSSSQSPSAMSPHDSSPSQAKYRRLSGEQGFASLHSPPSCEQTSGKRHISHVARRDSCDSLSSGGSSPHGGKPCSTKGKARDYLQERIDKLNEGLGINELRLERVDSEERPEYESKVSMYKIDIAMCRLKQLRAEFAVPRLTMIERKFLFDQEFEKKLVGRQPTVFHTNINLSMLSRLVTDIKKCVSLYSSKEKKDDPERHGEYTQARSERDKCIKSLLFDSVQKLGESLHVAMKNYRQLYDHVLFRLRPESQDSPSDRKTSAHREDWLKKRMDECRHIMNVYKIPMDNATETQLNSTQLPHGGQDRAQFYIERVSPHVQQHPSHSEHRQSTSIPRSPTHTTLSNSLSNREPPNTNPEKLDAYRTNTRPSSPITAPPQARPYCSVSPIVAPPLLSNLTNLTSINPPLPSTPAPPPPPLPPSPQPPPTLLTSAPTYSLAPPHTAASMNQTENSSLHFSTSFPAYAYDNLASINTSWNLPDGHQSLTSPWSSYSEIPACHTHAPLPTAAPVFHYDVKDEQKVSDSDVLEVSMELETSTPAVEASQQSPSKTPQSLDKEESNSPKLIINLIIDESQEVSEESTPGSLPDGYSDPVDVKNEFTENCSTGNDAGVTNSSKCIATEPEHKKLVSLPSAASNDISEAETLADDLADVPGSSCQVELSLNVGSMVVTTEDAENSGLCSAEPNDKTAANNVTSRPTGNPDVCSNHTILNPLSSNEISCVQSEDEVSLTEKDRNCPSSAYEEETHVSGPSDTILPPAQSGNYDILGDNKTLPPPSQSTETDPTSSGSISTGPVVEVVTDVVDNSESGQARLDAEGNKNIVDNADSGEATNAIYEAQIVDEQLPPPDHLATGSDVAANAKDIEQSKQTPLLLETLPVISESGGEVKDSGRITENNPTSTGSICKTQIVEEERSTPPDHVIYFSTADDVGAYTEVVSQPKPAVQENNVINGDRKERENSVGIDSCVEDSSKAFFKQDTQSLPKDNGEMLDLGVTVDSLPSLVREAKSKEEDLVITAGEQPVDILDSVSKSQDRKTAEHHSILLPEVEMAEIDALLTQDIESINNKQAKDADCIIGSVRNPVVVDTEDDETNKPSASPKPIPVIKKHVGKGNQHKANSKKPYTTSDCRKPCNQPLPGTGHQPNPSVKDAKRCMDDKGGTRLPSDPKCKGPVKYIRKRKVAAARKKARQQREAAVATAITSHRVGVPSVQGHPTASSSGVHGHHPTVSSSGVRGHHPAVSSVVVSGVKVHHPASSRGVQGHPPASSSGVRGHPATVSSDQSCVRGHPLAVSSGVDRLWLDSTDTTRCGSPRSATWSLSSESEDATTEAINTSRVSATSDLQMPRRGRSTPPSRYRSRSRERWSRSRERRSRSRGRRSRSRGSRSRSPRSSSRGAYYDSSSHRQRYSPSPTRRRSWSRSRSRSPHRYRGYSPSWPVSRYQPDHHTHHVQRREPVMRSHREDFATPHRTYRTSSVDDLAVNFVSENYRHMRDRRGYSGHAPYY